MFFLFQATTLNTQLGAIAMTTAFTAPNNLPGTQAFGTTGVTATQVQTEVNRVITAISGLMTNNLPACNTCNPIPTDGSG